MQNRRFVAWISSVEVKRTWKTHRIAPTLLIRKHSIRFTLSEFRFEGRPRSLPCLFDLEIEADRSIEQFAKVHLIQVLLVYCWCGYRNFCLVPFFWANLFFLFQGIVYVSSVLKSFVPQSDSQYGVYILAQKLALHSSPTHSIHRNADLLTFHFFVTWWSRWALFGDFFLVVPYLTLLGFARLKYLCICKYTCGSQDCFLQSSAANLELLWISKFFVWWATRRSRRFSSSFQLC